VKRLTTLWGRTLLVALTGAALLPTGLRAGTAPKYPIATLPVQLRENAHAVVRDADETFVVKSVGRTVQTVRRAVTIFDEAGSNYAREVVVYDQLSSVNFFRGAVYDAEGRQLRTLRAADIRDIALSDGFSLASDGRGRTADLRQPVYPYTVEFEYEVASTNTLFYPIWRPQDDEEVSGAGRRACFIPDCYAHQPSSALPGARFAGRRSPT
jgi:hypothetical protein